MVLEMVIVWKTRNSTTFSQKIIFIFQLSKITKAVSDCFCLMACDLMMIDWFYDEKNYNLPNELRHDMSLGSMNQCNVIDWEIHIRLILNSADLFVNYTADSPYTNTGMKTWHFAGNILTDAANQNTSLKARKKSIPTPSRESRTDEK